MRRPSDLELPEIVGRGRPRKADTPVEPTRNVSRHQASRGPSRDERGMVTAFVVLMTLSLVMFIGLVLDGGYTLAARREAIDEADGAARAAAQAVNLQTRTSSRAVLDPRQAQAAVDSFLGPTGHTGRATVVGDTVTVTVSFAQRLYILGAGGLFSVTVTGRGSARAVTGVRTGGLP